MSVDFVIAVPSDSVLFVISDGLKALVPDLQQHGVLLISHKEVIKTSSEKLLLWKKWRVCNSEAKEAAKNHKVTF